MYEKAYKQAVTLADQIRARVYTGPVERDRSTKGFFSRPENTGVASGLAKAIDEQKTEKQKTPEDLNSMVLDYMASIRNQSEEIGISPLKGDVGKAAEALGMVESSNNYKALGPVVKKGAYKGQRAYGKYQVMEGNIPSWTKMALGYSMSKEDFLESPRAQDAVVMYQLSKNFNRYGSWEDAASVWFSGRPVKKAGNASDGYNTVPEYITKFKKYFRK